MDPTSADYLIDPYAPVPAARKPMPAAAGFSIGDIPPPLFIGLGLSLGALYLLLRPKRGRR